MPNTSASPLLHFVDRSERSLAPLPPYRTRSNSLASDEQPPEEEEDVQQGSRSRDAVRATSNVLPSLKTPTVDVTPEEETQISGWPREPRRLRDGKTTMIFLGIVDVVVMLAPIYFIVLAGLAARLDGKPTNDNPQGKAVVRMSKLGPTMYPIIFAAVAGRSLKMVARFCAERGSKLGVLELLLASQTVWGTFESQLLLRRFTVIGAHLFILWSLSPLGGQASLRLLNTVYTTTNTTSNLKYLPTIGMSYEQFNHGVFTTGDPGSSLSVTNALYIASLLAPETVKSATQDTWGNLKIPRLSTVQNTTQSADGWATVPSLNLDNYTALVGLPVSGMSTLDGSSMTFNLEYSYMDMQCSADWAISAVKGNWTKYLGNVWASTNGSAVFYNNETESMTSFFLDTNLAYDDDRVSLAYSDQNSTTTGNAALQARRNVLFGSEYYGLAADNSDGYQIFYRNCTVWTEYLEAEVKCTSESCGVTRLRASVKYADRNNNLTPFDLRQASYYIFQNFPLATGSMHDSDATPSELFIRGANTPFISNSSSISDITAISAEEFASRLGQLLNTYYQVSISPMSFVGNLPKPDDSLWSLNNTSAYPLTKDAETPFYAMNSTALVSTMVEVYVCNYLWFALLLASSCVLLLVGLAGTALKYRCLAPDMMGFVTSLTYNNPHVKLPPGGTALGAMERARLLKDVRVKIGDAQTKSDVGHVVFATLDQNAQIGHLSRSKTYL